MLVRLDGIGDAAVCAPLIAALRAAGHRLGIALSTRNAGLFAPGVFDETYALERIPWPQHGSTPQTYAPALAAVRRAGYDVALIASEEPEAFALARDGGVRVRAGFWNGWEKPLKSLWVRTQVRRAVYRPASQRVPEHEVRTLFRLGRGWVPSAEPPRDPDVLRPLFLAMPVERGRDVAIQATAKWAQCGVDEDALAETIRALAAFGPVRLLHDAREADYARRLGERSAQPAESFASLEAWVRALAAARVLLTPDTGALHVAGMLGTPVVAVYPHTPDRALQIERWSPWAAPYRARTFGEARSAAVAAALVDCTAELETIRS